MADTKHPTHPWGALVGVLVLVALITVWTAQGTLAGSNMPVGRAAVIAADIALQTIPFLLPDVFVAELIRAFVSSALIARVFPMNPVASVLTALVAAFLLPVCDCSAVPTSHSLLYKGVPLSAATTLMLAPSVINPLVVASTCYTFDSWMIVDAHIGLSITVALSVGLSMLASSPGALCEEAHLHDGDPYGCDGGCETPDRLFSGIFGTTGHSFRRILPYLLSGMAASVTAQVFQPVSSLFTGLPAPGALALMMTADFAPSLCSSSGAVVTRSLTSFAPQGAFMRLMIYGPMTDVKNIALPPSRFHDVLVLRLFATVTCVAVAIIGGAWWMGVLT